MYHNMIIEMMIILYTVNDAGGVVYVRWGHTSCPFTGAQLVYSGRAGGSGYGQKEEVVIHSVYHLTLTSTGLLVEHSRWPLCMEQNTRTLTAQLEAYTDIYKTVIFRRIRRIYRQIQRRSKMAGRFYPSCM